MYPASNSHTPMMGLDATAAGSCGGGWRWRVSLQGAQEHPAVFDHHCARGIQQRRALRAAGARALLLHTAAGRCFQH